MKLKPEELEKILQKPGYSVRASPPKAVEKAPGDDLRIYSSEPTLTPAPRKESKLEIRFSQQLAVDGMPPYQRNFFFLPDRDLELDFAWAPVKVGVEIQGGVHSIKLARDCEKLSLALLAGWKILPLDKTLVRSGRGLEMLLELLRRK